MAYGLQRDGRDGGRYVALAALSWLGGEYRSAKLALARKLRAQGDGRADFMGGRNQIARSRESANLAGNRRGDGYTQGE